VLGVVLRHKAAHSAGTLLMWALQRPQLIDMDHAEEPPAGIPATLTGLLYQSSSCLGWLAVTFAQANSYSSSNGKIIGTYAAAMTQQLEQSGGWHTSMHWAASTAAWSTILACVSVAAPAVTMRPISIALQTTQHKVHLL
jgi:hypothetical protein